MQMTAAKLSLQLHIFKGLFYAKNNNFCLKKQLKSDLKFPRGQNLQTEVLVHRFNGAKIIILGELQCNVGSKTHF